MAYALSNRLDHIIFLQAAEPCEVRTPNSLHISVMTSGWVAINTTTVQHDHQSGSQVVIRIKLPQDVDMCSLLVSIRARNNAGMSSPTEIEVGRSLHVLNCESN